MASMESTSHPRDTELDRLAFCENHGDVNRLDQVSATPPHLAAKLTHHWYLMTVANSGTITTPSVEGKKNGDYCNSLYHGISKDTCQSFSILSSASR